MAWATHWPIFSQNHLVALFMKDLLRMMVSLLGALSIEKTAESLRKIF
jgi:hypothetical protein